MRANGDIGSEKKDMKCEGKPCLLEWGLERFFEFLRHALDIALTQSDTERLISSPGLWLEEEVPQVKFSNIFWANSPEELDTIMTVLEWASVCEAKPPYGAFSSS